jgi:hypothetical protein
VTNLFGRPTFVRPTNVDGALQIFTPHWPSGCISRCPGCSAARFAKSMAMALAAVPSRLSRAPNCYRAQPIDFEELESHGDEPITEPSIFIGGERDSGKLR